ncbi:hypothetical protein VTK56DRAFT_7027 [Thermocarpiscus australiensis]
MNPTNDTHELSPLAALPVRIALGEMIHTPDERGLWDTAIPGPLRPPKNGILSREMSGNMARYLPSREKQSFRRTVYAKSFATEGTRRWMTVGGGGIECLLLTSKRASRVFFHRRVNVTVTLMTFVSKAGFLRYPPSQLYVLLIEPEEKPLTGGSRLR